MCSDAGAGSLEVVLLDDAIRFATRNLARTAVISEVRKTIRAGLLNGIVPGLLRIEADTRKDADGGTTKIIRKARLCELNLVARHGLGPDRAGGRRRRWYV